ncbi:AAA family ATPase [bacterium]|nr:AAA family ATPase [bacterium]
MTTAESLVEQLPPPALAAKEYFDAGFPIIYIVSWEEERVCEHLGLLCTLALDPPRSFVTWSATEGFSDRPDGPEQARNDPIAALDRAIHDATPSLFVLKDFHVPIRESADVVRRIRDAAAALRGTDRAVVFLAPITQIPPELVKDVVVHDYALPDVTEIASIVENEAWTHAHGGGSPATIVERDREAFLRMFLGLTRAEIRRTVRKMLLASRELSQKQADFVIEEKRQILRKTEILDFIRPRDDLSQVGGLDRFKQWCRVRERGFSREARDFGLPIPKGILLTGISGCGKSLAITALAKDWNLPLLRLDMGRIFSGIAGGPEESLRRAILTAEAVSPCILWVDEIEMGVSVFSDSVESGSTSRIFASFLTWMQEKTQPVFIAATANDIDRLPPEFIRKGRFDEVFFVDLPEEDERAEIFRIHLKKRKQDPTRTSIENLARSTKGFTGAEIEQILISALYECFAENRSLDLMDIYRNIDRTVPLSITMKEQITKTKRWADNRAVRANK